MTPLLRHLGKLLLALTLAVNGWGLAMHAHAAEPATVEAEAETVTDCAGRGDHVAPAPLADASMPADCCDTGACDGCPCGMHCSQLAQPGQRTLAEAMPQMALPVWHAAGFALPPPAQTLRPPIA